jgi:hypothetical protein
MALALLLILLALIIGGVGLVVKGLVWALLIAAILLVVGAVVGFGSRSGSRV